MSVFHKTFYTCKEASELVIKKRAVKLSLQQRMKLWVHLWVCKACKAFDIQNQWLDDQVHAVSLSEDQFKMPSETKQKIASRLSDEMKN